MSVLRRLGLIRQVAAEALLPPELRRAAPYCGLGGPPAGTRPRNALDRACAAHDRAFGRAAKVRLAGLLFPGPQRVLFPRVAGVMRGLSTVTLLRRFGRFLVRG